MKHIGDLEINDTNRHLCETLTSVTGWLNVRAEASFPALTSVTGWLNVRAEASFPALTSVTGGLNVYAEASFPGIGRVIAFSRWALILLNDGRVCAGCREPMTVSAALKHWDRNDERAIIYTKALKALGPQ